MSVKAASLKITAITYDLPVSRIPAFYGESALLQTENNEMIQLTQQQVTEQIRQFSSLDNIPGKLRFGALLAGHITGRVWTDDSEAPTWVILQEAAYGTLYLKGVFPEGFLVKFINGRQQGEVLYGFWEGKNSLENQLPPAPYVGDVWESDERLTSIDLSAFAKRIPADCEIRPIDAELFKQIQDYEFYAEMFGSPGRALEKGFGYCLMQGEAILSEVFAGASHQGVIEIGVNTREAYHRKGYATITCSALISEAERRGYRTYWNCAAQNTASVALAHRLGFTPMKRYRLLGWF